MTHHSHPQFHIDRTQEEEALLRRIDFKTRGRKTYLSNREPVANLMDSLVRRQAIPFLEALALLRFRPQPPA